MANKPQALIKLSGPNRKVSFISEDGETINAIKEGINTYKLSGSDSPTPIIESVYTYKGSKATYDELPTENNKVGDVWNVVAAHDTTPAGTNYAWTGTEWDALGGTYVDTNTWRPIQVDGTEQLSDSSTPINVTGSGSTTVSYDSGTITVATPAVGSGADQVAAGNHTHSGYAATSHTHSEYAASSHNHTKSQITDFPTLATVATSGSYNDLKNKPTIPAAYTLPTAAANVLGGVKVGSGLSITNGVLSATGGGGSGNAGTKVVTVDNKTSLQAVTSLSGVSGGIRGNGAVDLQQWRSNDSRIAAGDYSVAMGKDNRVEGGYSVAIGEANIASGNYSVAIGSHIENWGYGSVAVGSYFANKQENVVCTNSYSAGPSAFRDYDYERNTDGNTGFKGILVPVGHGDNIILWDNLHNYDTLIADIHIIREDPCAIDGPNAYCAVKQIVIRDTHLIRNEFLWKSENTAGEDEMHIGSENGLFLELLGNPACEYQIGIHYTLFSGEIKDNCDDSSSSS